MTFDIDALDHLIYGRLTPEASPALLASSGPLTSEDATIWQAAITLDPMPAQTQRATQSVGIFHDGDDNFLLSRVMAREANPEQVIYQHIRLPRSVLQALAGNIGSLVEMIEESIPHNPAEVELEPLRVPPVPTWTSDKRMVLFNTLISQFGDMSTVLKMLAAVLSKHHLVIRGFPHRLEDRLNVVQGLMMLLPAPARPDLTFATNVADLSKATTMITFSEDPAETAHYTLDMNNGATLPTDDSLRVPYVQSLETMWSDKDLKAFVTNLRAMELMAIQLMSGKSLQSGLDDVAERLQLDAVVNIGDDDIPADVLKAVFNGVEPQPGSLLIKYMKQLLRVALTERDTEAVAIIHRFMQKDNTVYDMVIQQLETLLNDEPDAVYFFVRTTLSEQLDDRWIPILHSAAVISMRIVLQQGSDAETVMTWLKLIANEPPGYQLGIVLRDGIRAAQTLTHKDGELGRRLLAFTARRVPDLIEDLLADDALLATIEPPVGPALHDYDAEAVKETIALSREMSLILMAHALEDAASNPKAAAVFDAATVDYLWSLHQKESAPVLPVQMQPSTILDHLINQGRGWATDEAQQMLIKQSVLADDAETFLRICQHLLPPDTTFDIILASFETSNLKPARIVKYMRQLIEQDSLSPQQAVDLFLRIVGAVGWSVEASLPYIEQIARMFQQNQSLTAPYDALQRMLDVASEARSELVTRVVIRRMLAHLETLEDESQQVTLLIQITSQTSWSNPTRNQLITWWRTFARNQPITRLQQIDKSLNNRKSLEWARSITWTAIAIRKMMGKRSLEEFADAIGTAYSILQALTDSFDTNRQQFNFDPLTVRSELDARGSELTPDERSVLAKNLRELADLITNMADRRSKATLIRREEDIERQLLAGDQEPESAIDTMRWLSGYLSGLQDDKD